MLFVIYAFGLILINSLPIHHFLQVILDARLFIYGMFFFSIFNNLKSNSIDFLNEFFEFVLILCLPFCFIQIVSPDFYYFTSGVIQQDRGLWGINLSSFFYSRVAFAQFLVVFIIFYSYMQPNNHRKKFFLVLSYIFLFFTFSRKEIFFAFAILPIINLIVNKDVKLTYKFLTIVLLSFFFYIIAVLMYQLTVDELSEDYVRYQIFQYSFEITKDYFPIGSGPGTFGSIFSMSYQDVYEMYNVPERIVYGYSNFGRGPIFDMFLTSLIAEYGLGVILYILFLFSFVKVKSKSLKNQMIILILFLVYCSIMTPAFNTITSIFCLACLATMKLSSIELKVKNYV